MTFRVSEVRDHQVGFFVADRAQASFTSQRLGLSEGGFYVGYADVEKRVTLEPLPATDTARNSASMLRFKAIDEAVLALVGNFLRHG